VADEQNELSALLGSLPREARLDLSAANPTVVGLPDPRFAALLARGEGPYAPDPRGLASARDAVRGLYAERGLGIEREQVLLTASTSEAYSYLLTALCDAGDQIAVPEPSYPLFEHLARLCGVEVVFYRLGYDGAWHIDFASLEAAVTARTRAVFVVSPNNPTGSFLKPGELERLHALGLPLVVDEVFRPYRWSSFTGAVAEPLAEPPVLTCVLDGLSKRIGAPELKLGWLVSAGPGAEECQRRLEVIADTFLSVGGPVQRALPELLAAGQAAQGALRERIEANLRSVRRVTAGSAVSVLHGEGGWYVTLKLPAVHDEQTWLQILATRERLVAHPGWLFDFHDAPLLVVSLILEEGVFRDALERLVGLVNREC
jgi:aspartate/methionine/tyrosine aminotransferase